MFFVSNIFLFTIFQFEFSTDKRLAGIQQNSDNNTALEITENDKSDTSSAEESPTPPPPAAAATPPSVQTSVALNSSIAPRTIQSTTAVITPVLRSIATKTTTATAQPVPDASKLAKLPTIRVKALESMTESIQPPVVNASNSSHTVKIVNGSLPFKKPNVPLSIKMSTKTSQPASITNATNKPNDVGQPKPPVKLWNDVMQKNAKKPIELLVISNGNQTNKDNSVICLKPTEQRNIENAKENSSALKIGQVFESVSDEFVEDLLVEKASSLSPMLDTLVKQIATDQNGSKPAKGVPDANLNRVHLNDTDANRTRIIYEANEACFDYRCNICLQFNDSFTEFKSHMFRIHQYALTCQACHESFITRSEYNDHLTNATCRHQPNSKRSFICIVDPPVVLMKNDKVFAFRCKHCDLAFKNQRNYVQHAQRHARMFRCKRCEKSKAVFLPQMQQHLKNHEEKDFIASQR